MLGEKNNYCAIVLLSTTLLVSPNGWAFPQIPGVQIPGIDDVKKAISGGDDKACNAGLLAVVTSAACAIATRNKKTNKQLQYAAACGLVTYVGCELANHYKAKQTKSQDAVVAEHTKAGKPLPEKATLTAFKTTVSPNAQVARGNAISFASDISVLPGRTQPNTEIVHEVAIVDSTGDVWGDPVKKVPNEASKNAGEYQSEFTLKLAKDMEEGQYKLRQSVYVNGEKQSSSDVPFQVLASGEISWPTYAAVPREKLPGIAAMRS